MSAPFVSVVIPTFRREVYVVEAVRSALAQAGVEVEVIVLDDSAEGSARAGIEAIGDPRVRYVHREVPSGGNPALVRNEGLTMSRGSFLHFLDDDDILEPGALAATVGALDRTPKAGVAVGTVLPFGDDPDALHKEQAYFRAGARRLRAMKTRFALVATMLFETTPLVNSECTIRRACALGVGGYSTSVDRCEDVDFYLRAIRRYGFVFVDQPVVRYRTGTPSLMHTQSDGPLVARSYVEIYRQYRRQYGSIELTAMRVIAAAVSIVSYLSDFGIDGSI